MILFIMIHTHFQETYIPFYWLTLQMYFDKIAELTMSRSDTPLFKEALVSLAKDSGLHPLVPYFSYFIADLLQKKMPYLYHFEDASFHTVISLGTPYHSMTCSIYRISILMPVATCLEPRACWLLLGGHCFF